MNKLGKKSEIFGKDMLKPLTSIEGRPLTMPHLAEGHKIICGYDQGFGEELIVCNTLEQMQSIYDQYASGMALSIKWYTGEDPGFITIIPQTENSLNDLGPNNKTKNDIKDILDQ